MEKNNYSNKIVNVYTVYDLDPWPRNPTNNFKFKNCLFGATSIVKNSDQEKWIVNMEYLTMQVHVVLIMTLLEIL